MDLREVYRLFPQLEWIEDVVLREKCAKVWLAAINAGHWDETTLKALPFVIVELKDCPVTFMEHVDAVTSIAASMYEQLFRYYDADVHSDKDLVIAGALMHDVGKLTEYGPVDGGFGYTRSADYLRHPLSGAILASKHDLPEKLIHIIATHSFEGAKSYISPEAFIVKAADSLAFNYLGFRYTNQMQ